VLGAFLGFESTAPWMALVNSINFFCCCSAKPSSALIMFCCCIVAWSSSIALRFRSVLRSLGEGSAFWYVLLELGRDGVLCISPSSEATEMIDTDRFRVFADWCAVGSS
jgi:hypothetical protein